MTSAATYYFTDCSSGGTGTQADPYCLIPPGFSTKVSVGMLFDGINSGTNKEATAGDQINLCCGTCTDTASTCTYSVAPTASGRWLTVSNGATLSRITIQGYLGDFPTISGDTNANGSFDSGEVSELIYIGPSKGGLNLYSFGLKRASTYGIHIDGNDLSGNVTLDSMDVREVGSCAWGDTDGVGNNTGCLDDQAGGFMFYLLGMGYDWRMQNSTVFAAGGMAIRHVLSNLSFGTPRDHNVVWYNNTFTNMAQIGNMWETYSWKNLKGAHITFQGNTFHDWFGGLAFEQMNRGAIIEDNTFICDGTYNLKLVSHSPAIAQGQCDPAISINEGNYGGARSGGNSGHRVTRNKFYGVRLGANRATQGSQLGWMGSAIEWTDGCRINDECTAANTPWCCCTGSGIGVCNSTTSGGTCSTGSGGDLKYGCGGPDNSSIDNNMIWASYLCDVTPYSAGCDGAGPGDNQDAAILIDANTSIAVTNNTIYDTDWGVTLNNGPMNGKPNSTIHIVEKNLISGASQRAVKDFANPNAGFLSNNNLYGATPYQNHSGSVVCADMGTVDDLTNVCLAPSFQSTSGSLPADIALWNLHILATGPDYNTTTGSPGSLDIDLQQRPFDPTGASPTPYDRGADEVRSPQLVISLPSGTTTSGDLYCDVSDGETITINLNYDNVVGSDPSHNTYLHISSIGLAANYATYASTTCLATTTPEGNGVKFSLGTFQSGGGESCTVTFNCIHAGPAVANVDIISAWFEADEVPLPANPGSTGDPLTTFFPSFTVRQ